MKSLKTILAIAVVGLTASAIQSCKKNESLEPGIKTNIKSSSLALPEALNIPATLSDSLIAYWTGANAGHDLSGHNNNGALNAVTTTPDRFGHQNGAYSFNGTTSYIIIPDSKALRLNNTDFTVNAWVKLTNYNASYGSIILSKHYAGNDNGWGWSITGASAIKQNVQFFGPGGSSANAYGNTVISLKKWHMVTSVYSLQNHSLTFYVDGVFDNTVAGIASPNALIDAELYIGRDNPSSSVSGYFFTGSIGDIRIYSRQINTTEINALFNATTAPTGNLVAFWPLANTPDDFSGNGHDGTKHTVTATADRFGNPKGAYQFAGTNSFITVPDSVSLRLNNTDFTLNAWINLDRHNESFGSIILSKHFAGNDNGWGWSITGNMAITKHVQFFGPGGSSSNAYGADTITTRTWHMVSSVYSLPNQSITFFVDGVIDKIITGSSGT